MSNSPTPAFTPRDLWTVIARHKKKIVAWPLCAMALGLAVLLYFPRTYRSQAQVFLRVGRESVGLDPTATTGPTISMQQGDRKDEVKSAMEVIKSRGLLAQVVELLGPERVLGNAPGDAAGTSPSTLSRVVAVPLNSAIGWYRSLDPISDRERAIVVLERNLYVGAERGATLIEMSYEAKTPALARDVCAALVEIYQAEHMRIQRSADSSAFFEQQQDLLRQQLDQSLEAVRVAKNEMGLADIDQRRATLEAQFSAIELDRLATQQQLATSQARAGDLENRLRQVPERLVASTKRLPNVGADMLRDQLYSLEVKSMELQSRYTAKHPRVQAVNDQLKDAEEVVQAQSDARTETTDEINPVHRQLSLDLTHERNTLAGLQARLAALDAQTKNVRDGLLALNAGELKIDRLNRNADLARGKYMQYAQDLEESRIDSELQRSGISNLSIVQPASLNERPVNPNKLLVALATLLAATAGTVVLVAASEWLHSSPIDATDEVTERNGSSAIPRNRVQHRAVSAKTNGHATNGGLVG